MKIKTLLSHYRLLSSFPPMGTNEVNLHHLEENFAKHLGNLHYLFLVQKMAVTLALRTGINRYV